MQERHGFDEGIGQVAIVVETAQHQALKDARHPHGRDVQQDSDGGQPEVHVHQARTVDPGVIETRDHVVERAERHHCDPAQRP